MFSRLLLAALLLPLAATAQRLDLGLTGGVRQSFTDAVLPTPFGGVEVRHQATSPAVGLEVSYSFRQQPLRLSTGLVRGELAQAFQPAPVSSDGTLELRTTAWQVPLRLHTRLLRLGSKATLGLRNGLVLQLQRQGKPRIGGDYELGYYVENYGVLSVIRKGETEPVYQLYPAKSRRAGALLLETGAELSYALTPALTLDLSAAYQAGLRQIEAPSCTGWTRTGRLPSAC